MTWNETPFKSIGEAHKTATKYELNPSPIAEKDGFHSFTTTEGNQVFLIAQAVAGGPVREKEFKKRGKDRYRPPKQEGPYYIEQDRMLVGPWMRSKDHQTLEDVEAHYRSVFVNFDNVEVLQVTMYRIDDCEYEYYDDGKDVWVRGLHERSFAGRDNFHWALARELFGSDPTPEQKQKITDAVDYVLHVWPDRRKDE